MRDIDIRRALRLEMSRLHPDTGETRLIEELEICQGVARVDLAVLNGRVHGYEIKSERDTLQRLHSQANVYSQALEFVTIVAAPDHLGKIEKIVPSWWGIWCADEERGEVRLSCIRTETRNPKLVSLALAQFLWRSEALQILAEHGHARGLSSKSKHHLWFRLTTIFTTDDLCNLSRVCLKQRDENWKALLKEALDDDLPQPYAKS